MKDSPHIPAFLSKAASGAARWMHSRGWHPQAFQLETWRLLELGQEGIVNAPTGSGKTYSLLLPFIMAHEGEAEVRGLRLIWLTPIRALAKEIQVAAERVISETNISVSVGIRTGDTNEKERAQQRKSLPNILITTPESLHLLLARKGAGTDLSGLQMIVADEWHELMGSKRGVMVELAVSRLRAFAPALRVWGISATIGNLPDALSVLLGPQRATDGSIVRSGIKKNIEVASVLPDEVERMPWSGHLGIRMAHKLLPILHQSTSTLVFTNTRAQCEVWYKHLLERDPSMAGIMAMHHGSISKELRHWVEDALYDGRLKVVVCTSSLDLGVDFAPVESIVQVGGPKGVARFLQRAGRSGHRPNAASKIWFFPTHSLELIEAAALREAIDTEFLESRDPLIRCFDVLVQYVVTLSLGDGFAEKELFEQIKTTFCFQTISENEWKWIMAFVTTGGLSLKAYPDFQRVSFKEGKYVVSNQRIARRHRISIGTIVSDTMMVVKFKRGGTIGHIEETFIAGLNEGDHFWFGGLSLQLIQVKELTAFVRKSEAKTGKVPSWQGGTLPLTSRMSLMLRKKITEAATQSAFSDVELSCIQPIIQLQKERSHVPLDNEFLIELFTSDEGYHAVFYPFEGRLVHEGLASLFAWRMSQLTPISFSLAYNDYGFELLSDQPIPIQEALEQGLLEVDDLQQHLFAGINAAELASRKFRDIGSIAGLVFKGYPGQPIRDRHLQSSAQLIFQVLQEYEPDHLLLRQAYDEVMEYQLEVRRLREALVRIGKQEVILSRPEKFTPFAFPILVDRLRTRMTSETLEQRIAKMELAAD